MLRNCLIMSDDLWSEWSAEGKNNLLFSKKFVK